MCPSPVLSQINTHKFSRKKLFEILRCQKQVYLLWNYCGVILQLVKGIRGDAKNRYTYVMTHQRFLSPFSNARVFGRKNT